MQTDNAKKILKLNRLETHDRLLHVQKQSQTISECCQNLIDKKPFGNHPFYIFAHARTEPDGSTKRLIWQPRLTKPTAQTNSMLFKAYPGTDTVKIIWMIPDQNMWPQFKKGNVTHSEIVNESIAKFKSNRSELEAPESDDLSDDQIDAIYKEISSSAKMT